MVSQACERGQGHALWASMFEGCRDESRVFISFLRADLAAFRAAEGIISPESGGTEGVVVMLQCGVLSPPRGKTCCDGE